MTINQVCSEKNEPFPARVFVLIPGKSENAIIIRRGPSKIAGIFQWNVGNDKVEKFQWLKGRIYEYFSDISPDGKYFFYSANKNGYGYTVISKSPWLKAISLWNNVGGRGGGIFVENNKYLLYDGSENYNIFQSEKLIKSGTGWQQLEHGVYPARLLKNGWEIKYHQQSEFVFSKKIENNIILEKVWKRSIGKTKKGQGEFSEFHRVITESNTIEYPQWEWCEWVNNNFVWSENGCLFRAPLDGNPNLIYDFNQEKFEEMQAPY